MINSAMLKHIGSGNWVVGEISNHLLSQLKRTQRLGESEACLTARTLSLYRKVDLEKCLILSETKGIKDFRASQSAVQAINTIFQGDIQNAELGLGFTEPEANDLMKALGLIAQKNINLFKLLEANICLFLKAERVHFRSASHPHIMGSIVLGSGAFAQTTEGLATSIIHELAHQELFLLNLLDRLVVKEFDYNQIHAPFQGRKRPPIGRLHSMWALYRMIGFQQDINVSTERFKSLLLENCKAFDSEELTDFGKFLVSTTKQQAA